MKKWFSLIFCDLGNRNYQYPSWTIFKILFCKLVYCISNQNIFSV